MLFINRLINWFVYKRLQGLNILHYVYFCEKKSLTNKKFHINKKVRKAALICSAAYTYHVK